MLINHKSRVNRFLAGVAAVALLTMPLSVLGQATRIVAPNNKYSTQDDIKAGRQAAAEVERQMPILNNSDVTNYVGSIGQRLVSAIPPEYQHPEFRYTFQVVNARDINAFALPGGPMFVNRGMIEAAHTEGEIAGVMAHELSHVVLRHGTAQASKAQKFALGQTAGQVLGAIIGGGIGSVISTGTQLGVGTYFLKFSREYETQADVLGSQIMARAGYDPIDLANMFRTIEQQGGGSGPQWLSDHPNPGNRYERINQEARLIGTVRNPIQNSARFERVKSELRGMPRAPSMTEIAQGRVPVDNRRGDGRGYGDQGRFEQRVALPSTRYQTYNEANLIQLSVPDNWTELRDSGSVTFAPSGAYGSVNNGQFVFTHGVQLGVAQQRSSNLRRSNNLRQSTDDLISGLLQSNSYLSQQSGYQRVNVGGRSGLQMSLSGRSNVTGQNETVTVATTQLRNGNLFYLIFVSPQSEQGNYQRTFSTVLRSVRLTD